MITKQEIADGYDKVANKIPLEVTFYKRIKSLNPDLFGKVLDIGCGAGNLLKSLREGNENAKFHGIDISPKLVEMAKSNNPEADIIVGDAENMTYKSDEFDSIFMSEALEHMLDHKKSISEAFRVLKKGGKFVVTVPNRDWLQYDFYKPFIDKNEFQPVQDHYFCVNELKDILTTSGFKIKKIIGSDNLFYYGWKHDIIEQNIANFFPFLYTKMKRLIVLCVKE
jgi:ubiquinone/menaquinone biosynthesis C-methylase UbiE